MIPLRFLAGSLALMVTLFPTAPCDAAFHQWRVAEIYSSADGSVQFIELFNPTIATGETVSTNAQIRTASGNVYDFPANLVGNTSMKRLLIATDNFEAIPGAVLPNFSTSTALGANFFNPAGDTIRLFQPSFGEFTSVTWTGATAVPTDNVFSRLFNTGALCTVCTPAGIAANSPTNFLGSNPGATGSINRGDYNSDGFINAGDYSVWRKTLGEAVSPAGKGADGNTNGTIDEGDYTLWTTRFGNAIVGYLPPPGAGGSTISPEPTTLGLAFVACTALAVFHRWRRERIR